MTNAKTYELSIRMVGADGSNLKEARYSAFSVGAAPGFALSLSGFSSHAASDGVDLLDDLAGNVGAEFSAKDVDRDSDGGAFCAEDYKTAGW